jgi:hypothetical protein
MNWKEFVNDMQLLRNTVAVENASTIGDSLLSNVGTRFMALSRMAPANLALLAINVAAVVGIQVLPSLCRMKRRDAYRLLLTATFTSAAALLFIMLRPINKYVGAYTFVEAMGSVLILYIGALFLTETGVSFQTRQFVGRITFGAGVVFYGVMLAQQFLGKQDLPYLAQLRDDALTMNRLMFPLKTDVALVTGIQASTLLTAYEHADSWSARAQGALTAAVAQPNHFNYTFDGRLVRDRLGFTRSLHDLKNTYRHLYYWSSHPNFRRNDWRLPPAAIYEPVYVGLAEMLTELTAVALPGTYDPEVPQTGTSTVRWTTAPCVESRCIAGLLANSPGEIVTHYRFTAESAHAARSMPHQWQIDASRDGTTWERLADVADDERWIAGQERTYSLAHTTPYHAYRFSAVGVPEPGAQPWPGRIELFSAGGSDRLLQPTSVAELPSNNLEIDMLRDRMFERTGRFPHIIEADTPRPRRVETYRLGTGHDGLDAMDAIGRMPLSWKLSGSLDGINWQVLDHRQNVPAWHPDEIRTFPVRRSGIYDRFRFTAETGANPDIIRLYSLRLTAPTVELPTSIILKQQFWEKPGPFPVELHFDFSGLRMATVYKLGCGPDGADSRDRMPLAWQVSGSADGVNWMEIDRRGDEPDWSNNEERRYRIARPGEYRYYRIVFLAARAPIIRVQTVNLYSE